MRRLYTFLRAHIYTLEHQDFNPCFSFGYRIWQEFSFLCSLQDFLYYFLAWSLSVTSSEWILFLAWGGENGVNHTIGDYGRWVLGGGYRGWMDWWEE